MRDFICDKIKKIKPSGIRRLFDIANEIPDVISLGVGEPDFDTPWHIREEGIYSLHKGRTFYTSNSGLIELREEIARFMKRKYGLSYDPKHEIVLTVGGSEAIDIALRAILNPGDEVIYPEPCFVSYEPCVLLSDGVPVPIELTAETEFRLQPEQLEAAITPKTKALLISYPNNPTGAIMEREDLEKLVPIIIKHDLLVISDEIYSELSYRDRHVSIASLPGMLERTIVINGFSKSYAMTGWRLGFACGPAGIIEYMLKVHQFGIMSAPTMSQYAAISALKNGDRDICTMAESYNQRRRFLMEAFREMGLPCFEPFGAFYVFPDISEFGMGSEEFCTKLLEAENVAVVPGSAFGACGDKYVRISYAYSIEELKEAMARIARFIERLRTGRK
ncbi:aminotransferase class I/II-fold pyridoxal phosphate-dependent enzyme [Cloacibacillus porcorum]|uniref:aminotransferase class I/II-fold pyridoxal phosphate-dependent enzyme n=1 Tax=Cloacibacillus porcorum TaxID=1197717 RepID=UPI0014595F53|nr:aminotransferase class I/II-fold pyridoxal phosphate-dependent enzyme [Cloacibacillus porcorum]MCC8185873.1 aminotransferase class I/II-fold pyridoxal phosphate-dependent enzyme [Cloacibacillus porcorum]MDY5390385.1 aminotransferase class I/II-fold pyridoxal phosphate-dependent enzyme [Cloacibacillus porcorum]NMF17378.1 aminotransferase class I/II-fold pyridoxal phosphate-dependent enzyme [Cloacibacillus porcorum]